MATNKSKLIYWAKNLIIIFLLVFIDQFTKYLASVNLINKPIKLIDKVFSFTYLSGGNTGAAFGMFSGQTIMFIIFTILACLIIFKFLLNVMNDNYQNNHILIGLRMILLLLLAGAIGNLIDRILFNSVRDFIYFELIDFPIFNVADIYVTISCILLFIMCVFKVDNDTFENVFNLKIISNKK